MTEIRIIARLWGHITDLRMLLKNQSAKDLAQIETELNETASYCRRYTNDGEDIEET